MPLPDHRSVVLIYVGCRSMKQKIDQLYLLGRVLFNCNLINH